MQSSRIYLYPNAAYILEHIGAKTLWQRLFIGLEKRLMAQSRSDRKAGAPSPIGIFRGLEGLHGEGSFASLTYSIQDRIVSGEISGKNWYLAERQITLKKIPESIKTSLQGNGAGSPVSQIIDFPHLAGRVITSVRARNTTPPRILVGMNEPQASLYRAPEIR